MTAQIIEFPMDRVRQAAPARVRQTQAVAQVRPSVKIARAVIFWSLVSSVVYGLIFSATSSFDSAQATSTPNLSTTHFEYVTVMSGDTLWSLAEEYAPNQDPRDFIDKLVALNNLSDSVISAGMQLALPKN